MTEMAYAGECLYENFKLEYQVIRLEFIKGTSINIEAVCYNPYSFDKEAVFKYNTNNLNSPDERLKIANSIINSVINNLAIDKEKVYKLVVKNHKVFYICEL